jgi:hypothetical protein
MRLMAKQELGMDSVLDSNSVGISPRSRNLEGSTVDDSLSEHLG